MVPLIFDNEILEFCKSLAGCSVNASVKINKTVFYEGLIFTHRVISDPSILQISSFWKDSKPVTINFLPEYDLCQILKARRVETPKQNISRILTDYLPNRLADAVCNKLKINIKIADTSNENIKKISEFLN